MPNSWIEEIIEQLKRFLGPRGIYQSVLVPQYDLLKSFWTPTTTL